MKICCKENLTLNRDKGEFKCIRVPFLGEIIYRHGDQPDPHRLHVLTDMPPPTNKRELKFFLCILNYLGKFLSFTINIHNALKKLTSAKTDLKWNSIT